MKQRRSLMTVISSLALLVLANNFQLTFAADSARASADYVVVEQGKANPSWVKAGKLRGMRVPKSAMRNSVEICVAVGFTIESTGVPANVVILKTQSNKPPDNDNVHGIQEEAKRAVNDWRFDPAPENPDRKPIYTYGTMSMSSIPSGRQTKAAEEHSHSVERACDIPDFVDAVRRGDFKNAGKP
jgi:hypothetical protein